MGGLAACGGGNGDDSYSPGDAWYGSDGGVWDAAVSCGYTEANEAGNSATPESGLAYAGAATTICGQIDPEQASGADVDVDRYVIDVADDGDVLVRTSAPLGSRVGTLDVSLTSASGGGAARVFVDHGVFAARLARGAYELTVAARQETARTEAFGYRIALAPDAPEARCPVPASAPDHVEVDETARGHRGNDTVEVRRAGTPPRALTAAADAADATGLVLSPADVSTVAGVSGPVASAGDSYLDRDTFLVATGARTTQLELRLSWPHAATSDLDVLVFPAGAVDDVARAATVGADGDEVLITAVAPSSTYWVWVGAAKTSPPALVGYALTLCASEYHPGF